MVHVGHYHACHFGTYMFSATVQVRTQMTVSRRLSGVSSKHAYSCLCCCQPVHKYSRTHVQFERGAMLNALTHNKLSFYLTLSCKEVTICQMYMNSEPKTNHTHVHAAHAVVSAASCIVKLLPPATQLGKEIVP